MMRRWCRRRARLKPRVSKWRISRRRSASLRAKIEGDGQEQLLASLALIVHCRGASRKNALMGGRRSATTSRDRFSQHVGQAAAKPQLREVLVHWRWARGGRRGGCAGGIRPQGRVR